MSTIALLNRTFAEWKEDSVPRLSAAISYYTVFSLAPLMIIALAIAGLVFGREAAQGQVMDQLAGLIGPEGAQAIEGMVERARKPSTGAFSLIAGLMALLFGATGVFGELQGAMNTMWEVQPKPSRGFLGMIKDRVLSFAMVLVIGFLLLVSLIVSAGIAAAGNVAGNILPVPEFVMQVLNLAIDFGVIMVLFAFIYKYLPEAEFPWSQVWAGAALAASLFTIGKFAIGLYLGKSSVTSAYGAAGSLVVILIWVYYSAQILLFGAEFTQVRVNAARGEAGASKPAAALSAAPLAAGAGSNVLAITNAVRGPARWRSSAGLAVVKPPKMRPARAAADSTETSGMEVANKWPARAGVAAIAGLVLRNLSRKRFH